MRAGAKVGRMPTIFKAISLDKDSSSGLVLWFCYGSRLGYNGHHANLYTRTRPNIVPSRSLSRSRRCRPHPPAHKQARHCRSDHMSQPRNGTCSQPVGELYLDNASRRNFVCLFRIGFGVFLLMLGLVCGHERCRRYGQWLHNQLPTS